MITKVKSKNHIFFYFFENSALFVVVFLAVSFVHYFGEKGDFVQEQENAFVWSVFDRVSSQSSLRQANFRAVVALVSDSGLSAFCFPCFFMNIFFGIFFFFFFFFFQLMFFSLLQLVNVYFVILAALGLESFTLVHGQPKFVYIALSHSVSSIVVTGAMVATVIYSYAYSASSTASGQRALLWSWTGYAATASHLLFVTLHNRHDIPIDFYLQTTGAHAPASRMIGFGVSW